MQIKLMSGIVGLLCASLSLTGQTAPPPPEHSAAGGPDSDPLITVTMLGTGVPLLNAVGYNASGRVMSATLVQVGGERLLFDCGSGCVKRLYEISTDPTNPNVNLAVDKLFLTHLHSDHIADLPSLYSVGWLYRNNLPLRVWGPGPGPNGHEGTRQILRDLRQVFSADIYLRSMAFPGFEDLTFDSAGESVTKDTVTEIHGLHRIVYAHDGITVEAFQVKHDPVQPAFGYLISYQGKRVMLTGDTTYTDSLVTYGAGADVIVSEAWGWAREDGPGLYDYHCPPESCLAPMFTASHPKLAVLTHISGPPPVANVGDDIVNRVRAAGYSGPLVAGVDKMQVLIHPGAEAPTVVKP